MNTTRVALAAMCLVTLPFVARPKQALACSCRPPDAPAAAMADADAVFTGRVVRHEPLRSGDPEADWNKYLAVLAVSTSWKGTTTRTEAVLAGEAVGDCSRPLEVGHEYVVYAFRLDDGRLIVSLCSRTSEVVDAPDDVSYLATQPAVPLPPRPPNGPAALLVGFATVIAIAVAVRRRRARRTLPAAVVLFVGALTGTTSIAHAQQADECADAPAHPEWIFCHDFEAPDAANFDRYWDDVYGAPSRTFLTAENPGGVAGAHSMRLQVVNDGDAPLANGVTSGPSKFLGRDVDWDVIHYRRYVRFNADFHQGNFMHLGGLIACKAANYPWGCLGHAGERPKGDERFSSNLEPWSDYQRLPFPGRWGFYSYYYKMFKDCGQPGPDECYGDMFAPNEHVYLTRGAWHVLEMALNAGTPGQADGSQTFWVDGRKAFTAEGIAWRTSRALRVNEAGVYFYIHNNPARTTNILDVDNVVFSRRYIGPARCAEGVAITAPCVCGGPADAERSDNVHDGGHCVGGSWRAAAGTATATATVGATSTATATAPATVPPTATVIASERLYLPSALRYLGGRR